MGEQRTVRKLGEINEGIQAGELRIDAEQLINGNKVNLGPATGKVLDTLIGQLQAIINTSHKYKIEDGYGEHDTYVQLH